MDLQLLKIELSRLGVVQVCKADYVFTLFMTGEDFTKMSIYNEIIKSCHKNVNDEYPLIEVFKNEKDYFLLILKPKK